MGLSPSPGQFPDRLLGRPIDRFENESSDSPRRLINGPRLIVAQGANCDDRRVKTRLRDEVLDPESPAKRGSFTSTTALD
jgi:hypothetical protein